MRVFRFMPSSSSLFLSSLVIISGALACGSGTPSRPEPEAPFRPPEPPPSALPVASATAPGPTATPGHLPAACADAASTAGALALFAKAAPFTRLYLKGKFDELGFDEEVLALRFHGPQKGGMVVGSGN